MNNINRLQRPVLLSTLWIVLTLNYLYCDVLGLNDPAHLIALQNGSLGGLPFSPSALVAAGVLMQIPIAMVLLSRLLKRGLNRGLNAMASVAMIAVQGASLFLGTPPTPVYLFFSVIEIALLLAILFCVITWRRSEDPALAHAHPISVERAVT